MTEKEEVKSQFQDKIVMCKDIPIELVAVKGGTFTMGATAEQGDDVLDMEKPAHSVTLDDYYIGKFEVTQKLWVAVNNTHIPSTRQFVGIKKLDALLANKMYKNPSAFKGNKNPVENVDYDDCQTFITKLNYITGMEFRLPTEAEWEFAARGGNRTMWRKYSGSDNIDDVAWYDGSGGNSTHSVGKKLPNELGLYDMSGNVWEWCQDWFDDYSESPQINPVGKSMGAMHIIRGGSWKDSAEYSRVSSRGCRISCCKSSEIGLRIAISKDNFDKKCKI